MVRRRLHRLAFAAMLLVAACGSGDEPRRGPLPDRVVEGFRAPSSVLHDVVRDVYLVTNAPDAAASGGGGFVSRLQPDGTTELGWIANAGLRAPRGMAIAGDVLLVADVDTVRSFDLSTGRPLAAIAIPGALALADLSWAPNGEVWVTDPGLSPERTPLGPAAIFVVGVDRSVQKLGTGPDLGRPTAIVAQATGAYVVTWDTGEFLLVDARGHVERLGRAPAGELTGLWRVAPGRWLCASRSGQCLYAFDLRGGPPQPLPDFAVPEPSDFAFDAMRQRLLVPLTERGQVLLRRLQDPPIEPR